MQSKNNFRFLLAAIFCVLLSVAVTAQVSSVRIKQSELKSLGGNWEGELLRARLIGRIGTDGAAQLMPNYPADAPLILL